MDTTRYFFDNVQLDKKYHTDNETIYDVLSTATAHVVCAEGHSWSLECRNIKRYGTVCPYCSGRKTIPGVNDAVTLHPFLENQWDTHKNNCDIPRNLNKGSHTKYHWICEKGHKFSRELRKHVHLHGSCPYCSGSLVIPGETDVATLYPRINSYWDDALNIEDITHLSPQSNKRVTLRCPQHDNHVWDVSVQAFVTKNITCPFCSNKKVLAGFNDIATTNPEIAQMWGDNNDISPEEVTHGSGKVIQWKCNHGHTWNAKINNVYSNGSRCPICSNHTVLRGYNDFESLAPQHLLKEWDYDKNIISPSDIVAKSETKIHWVCHNGHQPHTWIASAKERFYGKGRCKICFTGISSGEKELADYIRSILPEEDIQTSVRDVIPPKELDIYIPSKNIAIEFNGLYWHSEACGKDRKYHYNKWKACHDKGIQLITIWEDEWRDKQDIVKSMLAHKLGASQTRKVFARKTIVSTISSDEARDFLDQYHIQGYASGTEYIALKDKNDNSTVAVSVWRKNKGALYLDRYATNCTVIGGMGKLLKAGKECARQHHCSTIVTFSDHQVSDGNLYEKLGFTKEKNIPPDYRYLVDEQRRHKFGYRLKKFRTDDSLIYEEGKTEKELAQMNGLERIWDYGKTRWVMTI